MPSEPTPSPRRIKIKGKTPRGLSKAQRMEEGLENKWSSEVRSLRKQYPHADVDPALEHVSNFIEPGDYIYNTKTSSSDRRKPYMGGRTKPSSTRKKLVKEGNSKFIGPRQFSSELAEETAARREELSYPRRFSKGRQPKKLRIRKLMGGEYLGYEDPSDEYSYGRGGIAKNPRLKELLMRLLDRHLGGGQEFDRDFPEVEY